jgi:AMMECR1 domain-containing protein
MYRKAVRNVLGLILGLFIIFLIYNSLLQNLPLSKADGNTLTTAALTIINGEEYEENYNPRLSKRKAVFVSVYKNDGRIACVGYTKPLFPLYKSVDYLTKGMNLEPYEEYKVVVTVFGRYNKLKEGDEIPVENGVMVRQGGFEGVVLPLTFIEHNLSKDESLELAAQKAGYSNFSWENFEVFTFDAQIFQSE